MPLNEWKKKFAYLENLKMPFFVVVLPGQQVLGYSQVIIWGQKCTYRYTLESSIYLRATFQPAKA